MNSSSILSITLFAISLCVMPFTSVAEVVFAPVANSVQPLSDSEIEDLLREKTILEGFSIEMQKIQDNYNGPAEAKKLILTGGFYILLERVFSLLVNLYPNKSDNKKRRLGKFGRDLEDIKKAIYPYYGGLNELERMISTKERRIRELETQLEQERFHDGTSTHRTTTGGAEIVRLDPIRNQSGNPDSSKGKTSKVISISGQTPKEKIAKQIDQLKIEIERHRSDLLRLEEHTLKDAKHIARMIKRMEQRGTRSPGMGILRLVTWGTGGIMIGLGTLALINHEDQIVIEIQEGYHPLDYARIKQQEAQERIDEINRVLSQNLVQSEMSQAQ